MNDMNVELLVIWSTEIAHTVVAEAADIHVSGLSLSE